MSQTILSYRRRKKAVTVKNFHGLQLSVANPTPWKVSCINRYTHFEKSTIFPVTLLQIKRRGTKPSRISQHSSRIRIVLTSLIMTWTNYGREFFTVSFDQRTIKDDFVTVLRRFLDVRQGIGSASPRVRACKHPLEYRPQFRVVGVPRRILEDNSAGMGRHRPPKVSLTNPSADPQISKPTPEWTNTTCLFGASSMRPSDY